MLQDFKNDTVQIKNLLAQAKNTIILIKENPSVDGLAAALSLYTSFKNVGKSVVLACPSELTVEASDLIGLDEVKKEIGSKNFIISWDYTDGSIEKVSYNIENNKFNLVIQPRSSVNFEISREKIDFRKAGVNADLIFVVNTQKLSLLNNFYTQEQELFSKIDIVNIDNSIENENFGKINLVSPISGSVSELCAELLVELGLKLEQEAATNLLTGIDSATKNLSGVIRPETLELAAWCLKNGGVRLLNRKPSVDKQSSEVINKVLNIKNDNSNSDIQTTDNKEEIIKNEEPQPDWLKPKIYHGSNLL